MFVAGKYNNIIACQSHPEFDLNYCIYDRIWPTVVEDKKRLTDDEVVDAKISFELFSDKDSKMMLRLISSFLRKEYLH